EVPAAATTVAKPPAPAAAPPALPAEGSGLTLPPAGNPPPPAPPVNPAPPPPAPGNAGPAMPAPATQAAQPQDTGWGPAPPGRVPPAVHTGDGAPRDARAGGGVAVADHKPLVPGSTGQQIVAASGTSDGSSGVTQASLQTGGSRGTRPLPPVRMINQPKLTL